jgi:PAS domain S-box-containing protein
MPEKSTIESNGGPRAANGLGGLARAYIAAVAAAAAFAVAPALLALDPSTGDLIVFLALAAGAVSACFLVVPTGRNHGFAPAIVVALAAAVLLPPGLVLLVPVAQHLPDLLRRRYPWYIQTFNVSNYVLDALAAWAVFHAVGALAPAHGDIRVALGGAAACVVYVVLNHTLLATALRLARGHSFRESGLFSGHGLWIDLGLAGLGIALAAFWRSNPYLAPALIAPLVLIHRSLSVLADLRGSESRFRAIFESTAMGSRLTDLQGRVIESNRSYRELLGYDLDDLAAATQAGLAHPEDRERDRQLFQEMVAGHRESYQLEKRFLRHDGTHVWGHLTSSLIRDADGKPEFTIGMVQDMTRRKELEEELRRSREETIHRLARAAEFRNQETGQHVDRVSRYCWLVAERLGLDEGHSELLRLASPLHDIGKIAIPDRILLKPGPLTPEERTEMEKHASLGYGMLADSSHELLRLAALVALTHHERFDGTGYPLGLAGEEIPLEGRITAVADVFDALTSDRVYRAALGLDETIRIMREGRGTHFDPTVLDAFLESLPAIMSIRATYADADSALTGRLRAS